MELIQLAKLIDYEGPIYAIEARGLDGVEPPIDTVERIADHYLQAIHEIQQQGPYLLAGYSFGGIVAFTMAQRLTKKSEKVALLAFLDSYATPFTWPYVTRLDVQTRRVLHWLFRASLRDKLTLVRFHLLGHKKSVERRSSLVREWLTSHSAQDRLVGALAKYRPGFFSGKITFVQPIMTGHVFPRDPKSVWGRHAAKIEIWLTPGDHQSQLQQPFVTKLADVLSQCIKEALANT